MLKAAQTARLRKAEPRDAAALAELAARLFKQAFGAQNTDEDMRAYLADAFSPEIQHAELSDPERVVWIAEDSLGAAVGYVMLERGGTAAGVVGERPAELQRIYADRDWHGRGVGAALVAACFDQARAWSCDVLWLAVWEANARAIRFYEKSGFRAVGRKTFLLGSDVQFDLVMARAL
ncbi:MAG: GNAT family N-acetyltransferase [Gemmatimonadaceae bacterium]